jgi:hypothetical protein
MELKKAAEISAIASALGTFYCCAIATYTVIHQTQQPITTAPASGTDVMPHLTALQISAVVVFALVALGIIAASVLNYLSLRKTDEVPIVSGQWKPKWLKLQWATAERERLEGEVRKWKDRVTELETKDATTALAAIKITKLNADVTYNGGDTYPLKIRLHLRNDSSVPIDVQMQEFRPGFATLKAFPVEVLQIRMRDIWYPKEHGVGHIALYSGQQFQAWIAPDEGRFNKAQLESHRDEIGTLVLRINGRNVDVSL